MYILSVPKDGLAIPERLKGHHFGLRFVEIKLVHQKVRLIHLAY